MKHSDLLNKIFLQGNLHDSWL